MSAICHDGGALRIGVYTDYAYSRDHGGIHADRAFALFLGRLAESFDRMVVVGRLRPGVERARYRLPADIDFVALPYYEDLARPAGVVRAIAGSMAQFWRALDDLDACWLLGPHPLALAFAAIAGLRRRRTFLGVRQDLPAYVRSRHPGRPALAISASLLDRAYRALARRAPTVVVGPALRRCYERSPRLLEITVSLIEPDQITSPKRALERPYGGELTALSVGRIESEKNPLILAEILAKLSSDEERWRLLVCGEGALEGALLARLEALGVAHRADVRGYVAHGEALVDLYRASHVLLHCSLTEGLPQVIVEALAAGLPVVATDVGGIGEAVGDAALLIPPNDAGAAVDALRRLAADGALRQRLIEAGIAYAHDHTLPAEAERVAAFLRSQ